MRNITLLLVAISALFATTGIYAATLNKCIINGNISYQQSPCPSNQARKDPTLEELNAAEKRRRTATANTAHALPAAPLATKEFSPAPPAASNNYRCDGRKHCSQMNSCAEAKYFLANCPGVMMDGDNDGIPCEDQWCSPR